MIRKPYRLYIKSKLDWFIAIFALIILSPIWMFMIIFLSMHFHSSPFFTQIRPGKGDKLFKLWKFKSMRNQRNVHGELMADYKRLTLPGKIIRATSLDELPQLINVIFGDMSIIGPRPLLPEYLPLYTQTQKRRHEVRPGITGWAQINGRNSISWEEKFRLDVWYVDQISFALDMKILWLTFVKVLRRDRINADSLLSMPKFESHA